MTVDERKELFDMAKPLFNQGLNADRMSPDAFSKMVDYAKTITDKYKGNKTVQDFVLSMIACFDGDQTK